MGTPTTAPSKLSSMVKSAHATVTGSVGHFIHNHFKVGFLGLLHVVKLGNLAGDVFPKFGNEKCVHGGVRVGLAGGWLVIAGGCWAGVLVFGCSLL